MPERACPRCWEPLEAEEREVFGPNVTVDVCPSCGGEYLDEGEIKRLTGDRDLHRLLTELLGEADEGELVCPSCGGLMGAEMLDLPDAGEPVEVDVCVECHGIWLDEGELETLEATTRDFGDISDAKRAEIWDAGTSRARRKGLLGRLLGGLKR